MKKSTPKKIAIKKNSVVKKTSAEKRVAIMKEAKAIPSSFFKVSLILTYDTIVGEGENIIEALSQFAPDTHFKSKGTMVIESQGKKSSIVMKPIELKRLLSKEVNKVFFQKKMLSTMK